MDRWRGHNRRKVQHRTERDRRHTEAERLKKGPSIHAVFAAILTRLVTSAPEIAHTHRRHVLRLGGFTAR